MCRVLVSILLLAAPAWAVESEIRKSVKLRPGLMRIREPLRVVADGITVDLGEAEIVGCNPEQMPDTYTGIGLIVEGRKNVTIKGGKMRGFKCAILVKDCEKVVIEGVDVSRNFRQRLKSTPEREDPTDWLRPHDNDNQEWRKKYGAGICLENCKQCVIRECVGNKQQNGALLDRCTDCQVYDNDMSFNSGWGIALWRSSRNIVSRNNFDWCVRGYSHGVYDRGQDSAGILVFEQCFGNRFIFNSATHGGDGFFLYAGEDTLRKTGRGGCNDNYVLSNDFSHAVANGIEATFSARNLFEQNRCDDCRYGIWAGYSYESRFLRNTMARCSIAGIAIEHGSKHFIAGNWFSDNPVGISLWWDDDKDLLSSKFAEVQHCRSEEYELLNNSFVRDKIAVRLRDTSKVRGRWNEYDEVGGVLHELGTCEAVDVNQETAETVQDWQRNRRLAAPGSRRWRLPEGALRGRKYIMVDEWGPLDPTESAVFPKRVVAWEECAFHVLGPAVEYEVVELAGEVTLDKGPKTLRVRPTTSGATLFTAKVRVGGKEFPIEGTVLRAEWNVRFWKWQKDPREDADAWTKLLATQPLHELKTGKLDFRGQHEAPAKKVPGDGLATRAVTKMKL
ncbi:MAG: right-handed parallel beta-helix repeat-containing protein, partial [Planctomycetota bacterium]|nr:right-handed parallel beta-helix repeat-containing protein [Planctomycetota bacterium]